ncbi:Nitroreductase [Desulfacinum hydrothermale DSM 13146]|uniref:Nitroreductase n=1 Tax=Desulfacinum hydrothermale DSM 13146 TaxID=1121390 RepID=A0A1W1XMM9_9BACT|nr:nitroreductase family protein [Desulfacinum hydrothermale]SMC25132.1 Nitroreductase [Desulfacinum hydrothermale DSM 13146]
MDLFEAIETRRSVQEYQPGLRIPRADWEKIFALTVQAPSSWNLQPWKFLVIEDEEKRAAIRKLAWDQPKITDASALICVLGNTDPHANKKEVFDQWEANGIIDRATHERWMKAVGEVYPTDYEKHEFAIRNSSFAAMTLMLAAWGLGYGTSPMIGFDKKAVSELIGVKPPWILSFLLSIGTPAPGWPSFPRQQRYGFDQVVAFETL